MTILKNEATLGLTRREFTWKSLGLISLTVSAAALPHSARADPLEAGQPDTPELITEFEANKLMLKQVQYVPVSVREGKRCENCSMLWGQEGDYGRCGLFQQGNVAATGWCSAWKSRS